MRCLVLAAAVCVASLTAGPAFAAGCSGVNKGTIFIHYDTGQSALSGEDKTRLAEFAETARFRDAVCVFAEVDAQGSEAANKRVAAARADTVRGFLISKGVLADRIEIAKEETAFTLFGLLPESTQNDRRVTVSHD